MQRGKKIEKLKTKLTVHWLWFIKRAVVVPIRISVVHKGVVYILLNSSQSSLVINECKKTKASTHLLYQQHLANDVIKCRCLHTLFEL